MMNLNPNQKAKILLISFAILIAFCFALEIFKKNSLDELIHQKPTIIFWQYWSGIEKKPLEDLVNKFNAEDHPFKVKMVTISMPKKKILLSIVGKVPPDLTHLDGDMVNDFALRGALEPLDDLFEPEYFEKFIPIYIRMLRLSVILREPHSSTCHPEDSSKRSVDEDVRIPLHKAGRSLRPFGAQDDTLSSAPQDDRQQYALPLMPTCEAMHINQNLLGKYGLSAPETLDDMVRIFDVMNMSSLRGATVDCHSEPCKARRKNLTVDNKGILTPTSWAQDDNIDSPQDDNFIGWLPTWPPWAGSFLPVVFGGEWAKDGIITANSPENIAAWTWAQENFARKIDPQKLAAYTEGFHAYQSPDNPFYIGRIAMENNGVWEKNLAKIYSPQLKVSVRPFPGKVPNATYVTVDALAIPRGAKHPKEAAEFIK